MPSVSDQKSFASGLSAMIPGHFCSDNDLTVVVSGSIFPNYIK